MTHTSSVSDQPVQPRATDDDRNRAEARLREATRSGALTLQEYDERLGSVLAARSRADLEPLVADLPATRTAAAPAKPAARSERRWLVAVMGGHEERGAWRPGPRATAVAVMGGVEVDLRRAQVETSELVVDAVAVMGGVEIVVPEGVEVELRGLAFMGGRENTTQAPSDPDAPRLIVNGWALMGGVEIRNAKPKELRREEKAGVEVAQPSWGAGSVPARSVSSAAAPARRSGGGWGNWVRGLVVAGALALGLSVAVGADANAVFGSRSLDPNPAPGEVQELEVNSLFGSVQVVVPEGVEVRVQGFSLFGSRDCDDCRNPPPGPDVPVVEIEGVTLFGNVDVVRPDQQ